MVRKCCRAVENAVTQHARTGQGHSFIPHHIHSRRNNKEDDLVSVRRHRGARSDRRFGRCRFRRRGPHHRAFDPIRPRRRSGWRWRGLRPRWHHRRDHPRPDLDRQRPGPRLRSWRHPQHERSGRYSRRFEPDAGQHRLRRFDRRWRWRYCAGRWRAPGGCSQAPLRHLRLTSNAGPLDTSGPAFCLVCADRPSFVHERAVRNREFAPKNHRFALK